MSAFLARDGGNGGDSSLTNSITGGATTTFTLSQTAIGGNGGRGQQTERRRGRRKCELQSYIH